MSTGIVVSGIGIVSPFGTSLDAFRDALAAGRSAVAPLSAFDTAGCRAHCAASVTGFEPARWIAPLKLRRMDTTSQYAIAMASEALRDSGIACGDTPDDGIGVVLGTYTAGGQPTEEFLRGLFAMGPAGAPALIFNATVANVAASLAGLELKLRGPNATISQKEISGLAAIDHGAGIVRQGRARAVLAGGVDSVYRVFFHVHDRFGALSHANGGPEGSRPFDETRNGFVLGEGGFVLLMESEQGARERGARLYGEVLGVASGGARVGLNQWPDRPEALARVIREALTRAGMEPQDVHVVYASANSTILDGVEALALLSVFGDEGRVVVTSIKGAIGESGAASAAACVAALVCGRAGVVPPIAGLRTPDPLSARLHLVREATPAPGPIVLINSVASGGGIVSAVLRVPRMGPAG